MYFRQNSEPLKNRAHLAIATVHGDEMKYVQQAFDDNWVTTAGPNITAVEEQLKEMTGAPFVVGLSAGTAAIHMALKMAAYDAYKDTSLAGRRIFASDMTFAATVFPAMYEGANLTFIDSEYETWNMDPLALEKAFEKYPDTKLVITANLYGTPAQLDRLRQICDEHGAVFVEDAAESFTATCNGRQTGTFGRYGVVSFNGNKLVTGSCGGALLTDNGEAAAHARKLSTQAREPAAWYQHEEVGYNYRMSNVTAGIIRAQLTHAEEHRLLKKRIYERYREGFRDLPVQMNPYIEDTMEPNFWLSCMIIDADAMCEQTRTDTEASYKPEHGRTCPTEILEALASINAEGRPIWKPMSMQPLFRQFDFVTAKGLAHIGDVDRHGAGASCDADIFNRGLCLPSAISMTDEQQDRIIETVKRCFE